MFRWKDVQQNSLHHSKLKKEITSSFARALKILQQKHLQFSQDEFVYSNDASNNLCSSLEAAFLHGLKDSVAHKLTTYVGLTATTDPFASMSFWSMVIKFTHSDVVTQLQHLTQINSEIGLCRAWVRLALNDGLMESYLHSMIVDTKTLKYFYHSYAYLRDPEQPGILKNYLTGLMSLDFKLSYNSSVLNYWNSSTLQLAGAVDSQSAPSPTIRPADGGRSGLDPQRQDQKKEIQSVKPAIAQPVVHDMNSTVVGSIQNISDHQAVTDTEHTPCLSVSEGSSYPDPGMVPAGEAKGNLLETQSTDSLDVPLSTHSRAYGDPPSEDFSILSFPDDHDNSGERGGTKGKDVQESKGYPSEDACNAENGLNSHAVIEDVRSVSQTLSPARPRSKQIVEGDISPNSQTSSPTRPRSRRVGEEDIKYTYSSSFSPPFSPERSRYSENTPDEIVQMRSSSSYRHSHKLAESAEKDHISPRKRDAWYLAGDEHSNKLDFHSVYQDVQQKRLENVDVSMAKLSDENFSAGTSQKYEKDFLRKIQKDSGLLHQETEQSKGKGKDSNLGDSTILGSAGNRPHSVNDVPSGKRQEQQKRLSAAPGFGSSASYTSVRSETLSHSTASTDRQSFNDPADEETSSNLSRKRSTDHEHDELDCSDTNKENTHSSTHQSTRRKLDAQTTEHVKGIPIDNVPEQFKQDEDVEEAEMELSLSPSRYGNSLSSMTGWSSEIESKREKRRQSLPEKSRTESFATMLRGYTPASFQPPTAVTLNEVIETLPCENSLEKSHKSEEDSHNSNSETGQWEESGPDNFEVLKSPSEFFCGQVEANSSRMYFLFHVPRELGLSHQNFACKGCSSPIGIIYGQPRLCEFDGGLYCYGCHENNEAYIPSSIVYDWDFKKKKVCQANYLFLQELEQQALYDIEELNPKLYNHVPELQDLKLLRLQLCYLKSYLFTCSQKVAESLRQKVWPREHLYDRRDLYSVADLLQVQSGVLQKLIKDVVKFSSQHVYDCPLCSLKGFVCEICRNPQVIYPFEVDTTVRCKICKAVYHKTCMTESLPCPKCERWGRHANNSSVDDHPEDYGMSPHI